MNISRLFPLLLLAGSLIGPIAAQNTDPNRVKFDDIESGERDSKYRQYWVGVFDGKKMAQTCIRLDRIVSVSIQTYMLEGSIGITECTIDTIGNNSIRIYGSNSEHVDRARDRLSNTRDLLDKHSGGSSRYPSKKFPEGTYSHNVEFQVDSAAEVKKIYESVLNAWVRNKGCTYKS